MFFNKDIEEKNGIFNTLRGNHATWKDELFKMNKPFFMLPTDFTHLFLRDISGGALKLYIFLGSHAKYRTGESWYSIEQVSLFFQKDERTIAKWFNELEKKGLIFRAQKGFMMKANTFLLTYGFFFDDDYIFQRFNQLQLEEFIKKGAKQFSASVIFNSGTDETSLIIIDSPNDKLNKGIFQCIAFIDIGFENIKRIKLLCENQGLACSVNEINIPINQAKNIKQALYTNLIQFLDNASMWE